MKYINFSIKIEPQEDDHGFRVLLIDAPSGQDRNHFNPAASEAAFAEPLVALQRIWCGGNGAHSRAAFPDASPDNKLFWPNAQKFGDSLFRALFQANIRSHLYHSLSLAKARNTGLRIRLHFDPRHPQLANLLCLPWEFLFDAGENRFLNLDLNTPVIRYLDIPKPTAPPNLPPPLRILLVWATPQKLSTLKIAKEKQAIIKALDALPGVEVHPHGHATLQSLRHTLRQNQYHVIHFMGHGGMTGTGGSEGLYLEDENGEAAFVNARQLAVCLSGLNSLRFVFLNACQYTLRRDANHPNPFTNTAAALLLEGIPAVLAMQAPIGDLAALTLASIFYKRLARGEPIETALTEARLVVYSKQPTALDWAAPVLYLRNEHGHLFPEPEKVEIRQRTPARPRRLVLTSLFMTAMLFCVWLFWRSTGEFPTYRLRTVSNQSLSLQGFKALVLTQDFYDAGFNPSGHGIVNRFEDGPLTIADRATGLAWQKGGSRSKMTSQQGQAYIGQLNEKRFEGQADWRLPTVEEALSLMETNIQNATHFIDTKFHPRQYMILTCDSDEGGSPWIVSYREGRCAAGNGLDKGYVRAVRSLARDTSPAAF